VESVSVHEALGAGSTVWFRGEGSSRIRPWGTRDVHCEEVRSMHPASLPHLQATTSTWYYRVYQVQPCPDNGMSRFTFRETTFPKNQTSLVKIHQGSSRNREMECAPDAPNAPNLTLSHPQEQTSFVIRGSLSPALWFHPPFPLSLCCANAVPWEYPLRANAKELQTRVQLLS
jgi:hypothetical protein